VEEYRLEQLQLLLAGFDADGVESQKYSLALVQQVDRWQVSIQQVREQLKIERKVEVDVDKKSYPLRGVEKNCYSSRGFLPVAPWHRFFAYQLNPIFEAATFQFFRSPIALSQMTEQIAYEKDGMGQDGQLGFRQQQLRV